MEGLVSRVEESRHGVPCYTETVVEGSVSRVEELRVEELPHGVSCNTEIPPEGLVSRETSGVTARSAVLHSKNDLLTVSVERISASDSGKKLNWGRRT
jgi:hypothetical protein